MLNSRRLAFSRSIRAAFLSQCVSNASQRLHIPSRRRTSSTFSGRPFERVVVWRQLSVGRSYSTLYRRTLLMKQFESIKKQYKDYILLFQVGDFYEIYGEDASEVTSRTSLRLTSKANVFMAGFPVRALGEWQRTLVEAGFQLALCDQIPSKSSESRLMVREVVKLVTPGTLIEPLDRHANYLLSVATGPGQTLGLAWVDVSTSEFQVSSCEAGSIDEDLERLCPSEVLLSEEVLSAVRQGAGKAGCQAPPAGSSLHGLARSALLGDCHLTPLHHDWFSTNTTTSGEPCNSDKLRQLFDSLKTDSYSALEVSAAHALLRFIMHTQRGVVPYLSSPAPFSHGRHMAINSDTRRALELVSPLHSNPGKATLLGCVDQTVTAAGGRLLKARLASPLLDVAAIDRRLASVELLSSRVAASEELSGLLRRCADLERTLQKVATRCVSVSDLQAVKGTLTTAGQILDFLHECFEDTSALNEDIEGLQHFPELSGELERALSGNTHGDYFMSGYSEAVDALRHSLRANEEQVTRLLTHLRKTYALSKLSVSAHKGYIRVLEVPKSQAPLTEKCSELIKVDYTQAKTRFSHLQLQRLNAELQQLEAAYTHTQEKLFRELCNKVMCEAEAISQTARALARLDVSSSLGLLAAERGWCRPEVVVEPAVLEVQGGAHPVVAGLQRSSFVGNDCCLDQQHSLWVITGPNMGGKSTFLRQNALIAILAQMGSFVPAESARLGVVDRLFARVGASDNVARHMSTFHMEMAETASILSNATHRSLVILDEIGRGTSTSEGLSIAQAVIEHLHNNIGCRTLVATHFHQLAVLSERLPRAVPHMLVAHREGDGIVFTYQIQPGSARHSFAVDVAHLAGLPREVVARAKELLSAVEKDTPPPLVATSDDLTSHSVPPSSCSSSSSSSSRSHTQEEECLKCIESLPLDSTTPVQALNILHMLKQKLQS